MNATLAIHEHAEKGSTLIEVLVTMVLFAIISLSMTKSAIIGLHFQKQAEIGNLAKNLAVSKAEELSGIKIDQLNDSYDSTEDNITVTNHEIAFTRVTDITVNSDGSRTIDITVSSPSRFLPKAIHYTTRFAPWES